MEEARRSCPQRVSHPLQIPVFTETTLHATKTSTFSDDGKWKCPIPTRSRPAKHEKSRRASFPVPRIPLTPYIASDQSSESDHDTAWFCSARCPENIEVAVNEYSKLDPPAAVAQPEPKAAVESSFRSPHQQQKDQGQRGA